MPYTLMVAHSSSGKVDSSVDKCYSLKYTTAVISRSSNSSRQIEVSNLEE